MLREYQRVREASKVEIAQARARLQEQTEQEKLRIHQQIDLKSRAQGPISSRTVDSLRTFSHHSLGWLLVAGVCPGMHSQVCLHL